MDTISKNGHSLPVRIGRNLSLAFLFAVIDLAELADAPAGTTSADMHDKAARAIATVDGLVWC